MRTAEQQIWDEARRLEKLRVEQLQTKARENNKKSDVVYRPEKVAKPWTWGSSANHSLHNISERLVLSIEEFDFDLNDAAFVAFLRQRAHLHLCGREGSDYWGLLANNATKESDFMTSNGARLAQEHDGKRHRFSDAEMQPLWKIFQYSRVFLQGAYDHFSGRAMAK